MKTEFITITAQDKHSGEFTGRTFDSSNGAAFKAAVQEWEQSLPYRRYELTTAEFIEDYPEEIQNILEELEVYN